MNIDELFQMQKKLDERIIAEKGLRGRNLLPEKILALQVELGELANEWRAFKFWSDDQQPRTKVIVRGRGAPFKNPLLEEFSDCLHFFISIGLDLKVHEETSFYSLKADKEPTVIETFQAVFDKVYSGTCKYEWVEGFEFFLGLGEQLGFTWEQIEESYFEKNKVNHQRQESGH